jgi:hypothetical protein
MQRVSIRRWISVFVLSTALAGSVVAAERAPRDPKGPTITRIIFRILDYLSIPPAFIR